jgi:hypothetical protein
MEDTDVNRWALVFLTLFAPALAAAAGEETREPFVAGVFYPEDPAELNGKIAGFFSRVPTREKDPRPLLGLILPHAGYVFSGQTAAHGYKALEGRQFDTVVLIGLYHRGAILGASVWRGGAWKTPLGNVPVDTEMADALFSEDPSFQFPQDAHLAEHSLEVHLPFLQRTLKDFKIVPILTTVPSREKSAVLARAVLKHSAGKRVLVVASTDMSHYHTDAEARRIDGKALDVLKKGGPRSFFRSIKLKEAELCGSAAVLTLLEIGRQSGGAQIEVLKYATSAEASGDESRVVGYGAAVLYKGKPEGLPVSRKTGKETLTPREQKKLLRIARQAVETYVTTGRVAKFRVTDPALLKSRAVFVTLRKEWRLRGCVGQFSVRRPLYLSVRDTAIMTAVKDERFPPVAPAELKDLTYEISVLSTPQRVKNIDAIELGTHGVVIRQGERSGVFLPKVATEMLWSKETFLNTLCTKKAGLPAACWEDPSTELYVFTSYDF